MAPPLFFFVANRRQPDGPGYVHCRVTVDKRNVEFATGIRVLRTDWNTQQHQVRGRSNAARLANNRMVTMRDELEALFDAKVRAGQRVTAAGLVKEYRAGGRAVPTLLEAWQQFIDERQQAVGVDVSKERVAAQRLHRRHVETFLKARHLTALLPDEASLRVLNDLLAWLRTTAGVGQNHAAKVAQSLKQVLRWCVLNELATRNPLDGHRSTFTPPAPPVFLSEDELQRLQDFTFSSPPLRKAADCFLFQCYTGLAYVDLARFRRSQHTRPGLDGREWLYMERQKTSRSTAQPATIRLLPVALAVLARHGGERLPVPTNQVYNRYLKEIAAVLGFDCLRLTSHIGRKTAGAQLLLAGMTMEAVSRVLGHSTITMTQRHYVSITEGLVAKEFRRVFDKPA